MKLSHCPVPDAWLTCPLLAKFITLLSFNVSKPSTSTHLPRLAQCADIALAIRRAMRGVFVNCAFAASLHRRASSSDVKS
jgi:hypothetical protein